MGRLADLPCATDGEFAITVLFNETSQSIDMNAPDQSWFDVDGNPRRGRGSGEPMADTGRLESEAIALQVRRDIGTELSELFAFIDYSAPTALARSRWAKPQLSELDLERTILLGSFFNDELDCLEGFDMRLSQSNIGIEKARLGRNEAVGPHDAQRQRRVVCQARRSCAHPRQRPKARRLRCSSYILSPTYRERKRPHVELGRDRP